MKTISRRKFLRDQNLEWTTATPAQKAARTRKLRAAGRKAAESRRLHADWLAFLRECKAAVRAQRRPDPSTRTKNLKWKRFADGTWRVVKVRFLRKVRP